MTTVPPAAPASLYVGDLKAEVLEKDLYDFFETAGKVASVRVLRDRHTRRSLGYAYVNFFHAEDAARALELLNYSQIQGRTCRICWSHRDSAQRRSGVANLFVSGLDPTMDTKGFHDTFSTFGNIVSCKLVLDKEGTSKGHGFVQFEKEEDANRAIAALNEKSEGGRVLKVEKYVARDKSRGLQNWTNLYVKNLPETFTEDQLKALFEKFGSITSHIIVRDTEARSRGFGFVNFHDSDHARAAAEAMNGHVLEGKTLVCNRAQSKQERQEYLRKQFEMRALCNLYVKNLEPEVDDERLKTLFGRHGEITSVKIARDQEGKSLCFGFVCFKTPEEAGRAQSAMNGAPLGQKVLYVAPHQRKDERQRFIMNLVQTRMANGYPMPSSYGPRFPMSFPPQFNYSMMRMQPGRFPQQQPLFPFQFPYGYPPFVGPQQNRGPRVPRAGMPPRMPGKAMAPAAPAPASMAFVGATRNLPAAGRPAAPEPVAPAPVAASVPRSEAALLSERIKTKPTDEQKQQIGEYLFPKIEGMHKDEAGKITGMLLEMDVSELLTLVESEEELRSKVKEAFDVLQQAKEESA